jgi:hypothetical protein
MECNPTLNDASGRRNDMTQHGWQITVATTSPDGRPRRDYVVAIQDPERAKAAIRRMG